MKIDQPKKFISRLAPSPSSKLHLGNALSFLITWSLTRKYGGIVRLRMDDLDERCKNQSIKNDVIQTLRWLEIDWDGPIIFQCDRDNIYQDYFNELSQKAITYPCFCSRADLHAASAPHTSDQTAIYKGTCKALSEDEVDRKRKVRNPAIRIEIPENTTISFNDLICGDYFQDLNRDSGDFIIRRSDFVFAYHLTSVIDDIEMGITHVIRGCDLLSSTPKQIFLHNLLDKDESEIAYAHHPLLVDSLDRRLAKRDSDKTIGEMRCLGATPSSIRGKIAQLLGIVDQYCEVSADEFIDLIDFDKLKRCNREIVVNYDNS